MRRDNQVESGLPAELAEHRLDEFVPGREPRRLMRVIEHRWALMLEKGPVLNAQSRTDFEFYRTDHSMVGRRYKPALQQTRGALVTRDNVQSRTLRRGHQTRAPYLRNHVGCK